MKPTPLGDEPCMSDQTLLVSVEDLINISLGPQDGNVVDFKVIQMILHILARQMRLLEQKVVLEVGELPAPKKRRGEASTSQSTSDDSKRAGRPQKRDIGDIKEETDGKSRRASADRGKDQDATDGGKGGGGGGKDQAGGKGQGGGKRETGGKGTDGGRGGGGKDQEGGKDGGKSPGGKSQDGGKSPASGKAEGGKGQVKVDKQDEEAAPKVGKKGKKGEKDEDTDKPGKALFGSTPEDELQTGMNIKEGKGPDMEKVLVVEKGPTTRGTAEGSRRSIEVVTRSQFALLEAAVGTLREQAGPLPPLTLPDNAQLRGDLARGTASLTDTMQAMQVSARVAAAEQAVARLGGLLTQLAAAGAIPGDAVARAAAVTFGGDDEDDEDKDGGIGRSRGSNASKSVGIEASAKEWGADASRRPSRASSRPSTASRGAPAPLVTQPEMADALMSLRDELMKEANKLIAKATTASEGAVNTAKAVAEKLDVAVKMNNRITNLYSLVGDYSEQLSGFDAGLTTQMQSFKEQMVQMRSDLRGGLTQLENANANAETAAVMELTERYELLVGDLESTMQGHQALTGFQQLLGADLRSLVACVEMLREQKADRDEVLDGLRDKADNTRLAGLLRQEQFEEARQELERRLEVCHDKFHRQELVWMTALKELAGVAATKAELMELLKMREESAAQLRDLHAKVQRLELVLGEPKAAVLTRQLARGAVCAACLAPALMDPADAASGQPPPLPRARPEPAGEPCQPDWRPDQPPDLRTHSCRRWVGGSHTLLSFARRAQAGAAPAHAPPARKYTGVGNDGRLYQMEAELQHCAECNPQEPEAAPGTPATPEEGAGDNKNKDARRRTSTAPAVVDPAATK